MSDYILYHHGVKGMKWGVRRTPQQLGHKVEKLKKRNAKLSAEVDTNTSNAKKYAAKSAKIQQGNAKYEKRLAKATARKAAADLKYNKVMSKRKVNEDKAAKYAAEAAKQQTKILKAQKKLKYNKWETKASQCTQAAEKAKAQIQKNDKLMNTYSKTISALDTGTVQQGRFFMQYVNG